MQTIENLKLNGFSNPVARWARFGPYYAMFPLEFAFKVVEKYSQEGDYILDPFAGRCSSIYAGGVLNRNSWGVEINPVGWLYGKVKLKPANKHRVVKRLEDIYSQRVKFQCQIEKLPEFFRYCFCDEALAFLLSARESLSWRTKHVDATLMSFILVHLHGKLGEGLSNQMRQTKSMGPTYSVNWWKKNNLAFPPELNPFEFLSQKIEWRYEKGIPDISNDSSVTLGDSSTELANRSRKLIKAKTKFSLLFTSPPYWSIANYHADQWLRLWVLGGADRPVTTGEKHKRRFGSKVDYHSLLVGVFSKSAKMMAEKNIIYIRTDAREFTQKTTIEVLKNCFPKHDIEIRAKPFKKKTQTQLFGDKSKKPGEVDIVMSR